MRSPSFGPINPHSIPLLARISAKRRACGAAIKLKPMNAFERKIIHDTIQRLGLTSESEGEDPDRCVVVMPN
ncbi:MAG: hypothetical protein EBY87_00805 [Actinobacteria bacterium]|nr:hypothetical protein [Actinomycetota bacterium]